MHQILREEFGLYRIEIGQEDDGFYYDIYWLDDDKSPFVHESSNQPYTTGVGALKVGLVRLAELFWRDVEDVMETKTPTNEGARLTGAGKGTRTPDILLGKKSVAVKPSELEVQS